jgi:tyrosyl-tRNA synthetase
MFRPEDVEDRLKIFTLFSLEDIAGIMAEHAKDPGKRVAQKALAVAVTAFVHDPQIAETIEKISDVLFGGGQASALSADELAIIVKEVPTYTPQDGETVADILVGAGLATSKRDARTLVEGKGVSLDDLTIQDATQVISVQSPGILRKGKKHLTVLLPR